MCGGRALSLFSPEELELAVAGLPHLDFAALEAGARVRDEPNLVPEMFLTVCARCWFRAH